MVDEEGGRGVSTALIVAGGIGCLLIAVVLFGGIFFIRASSVSVMPPPSVAAPPGWQEIESLGARGQAGSVILRGPADGSGHELRAYWREDGTLEEERSGTYSGEVRDHALSAEELALLTGLRP